MSCRVPAVVAGLCDDPAVFPPELAPLPDAVHACRVGAGARYAELVGPLVLPVAALPQLRPLLPAARLTAAAVGDPVGRS